MLTALIIAYVLIALLLVAVILLFMRLEGCKDDIVNMKFIKVEKQDDGGWSLKTRDGKPIFDL